MTWKGRIKNLILTYGLRSCAIISLFSHKFLPHPLFNFNFLTFFFYFTQWLRLKAVFFNSQSQSPLILQLISIHNIQIRDKIRNKNWIWNNHTINKKKKRWIINMNLSFEVEVLANIKGGLSIIYFCILIELPRKSAAFLPLLNLPVKTLLGKSMT